jgi:hypothetical protein
MDCFATSFKDALVAGFDGRSYMDEANSRKKPQRRTKVHF